VIVQLWNLARRTEDLFGLHQRVEESLKALHQRMTDLETRMTGLESREALTVAEARGAAIAAATAVAGGVISDAVTRVTRIEDRLGRIEERRLPRQGPD
jgi:Holliday junction resolvasome RuvABC endonuclease subunit